MATYSIELSNEWANQEFDVIIDNLKRSIHVLLQTVNNSLLMSISVDNEQLGQAFVCLPNRFIIPYPYMTEILGGNFIFETEGDNYPNYENFGTTCNLYFTTLDELNAQ